MAAAREQAEERRLERVRLEVERGDVSVQVVDRHERQAARPGERLRGGEPDEERADQARALRDRDGLDVVERRASPRSSASRIDRRARARGAGARRPRGRRRRSARAARACDATTFDRNSPSSVTSAAGGLVARGLEPEDHAAAAAASGTGSLHMISASSRLSV